MKGSNVPILMILHVVLQLRALAGITSEKDTDAFVLFLTNSFSTVSVHGVNTLLHKGLKVTADQVDVKDRVAVRSCEGFFCGENSMRSCT